MLALHAALAGRDGLEILCLGAHPDDIEIGCGGTIRKLCQDRADMVVHWVVLGASGDRGEEARDGALRFRSGAKGGELLMEGFRDGFFPFEGVRIKEFFESLKTRFSPDVIFTHSRDDRHQDHRLVSDLTWNTWRDHLVFEYEIPKWDGDLGRPNAFSPLSSSIARYKAETILEAFPSQVERHWFTADTFLGLMRLRGMECRAPEGFAEGFIARKILTF